MVSQASVILSMGGGWHVWWGEGHVWQGACMAGDMHDRGHGWQGVCVAGGMDDRGGGGHAWQKTRPLERTVRILLECILVGKFIVLLKVPLVKPLVKALPTHVLSR